MFKAECEICGTHQDQLGSDLTVVDVTSTCEEGTSWDEVTACNPCLGEYDAYKIVNVTDNGVTSSGWIIDHPKLYFKFFRI